MFNKLVVGVNFHVVCARKVRCNCLGPHGDDENISQCNIICQHESLHASKYLLQQFYDSFNMIISRNKHCDRLKNSCTCELTWPSRRHHPKLQLLLGFLIALLAILHFHPQSFSTHVTELHDDSYLCSLFRNIPYTCHNAGECAGDMTSSRSCGMPFAFHVPS